MLRRASGLTIIAVTSTGFGVAAGAGSSSSAGSPNQARATCEPGSNPSRGYGQRPPERGLRYGSEPTVLGCVRLPSGARVELVGYQQGERSADLCIDHLESDGTSHGCGSNRVLNGAAIDASGMIGRRRIEGAARADVASVLVRYGLRGEVMEEPSTLLRVTDPELLQRVGVRRPFGRYLAEVPAGARGVRVEALDRRGRRLGVASFDDLREPARR